MRGTVRRHGGAWQYQFTITSSGKRRHITKSGFATKKAAQQALTETLGRRDRGEKMEPSRVLVRDYLRDEWLPVVAQTTKPSTTAGYRSIVEHHLLPRLGDARLRDLMPSDLASLYAELRGRLSETTVRHVHACLHRALEAAVEDGLLSRNPARRLTRAQRPKSRPVEMHTWSAEQLRAFLASIERDRVAALFHLAAMSGMRRGELLALRWDDVDVDAGRVAVRRSRVAVGYEVVEGEPKSGRSRVIDVDTETIRVLRRWRARQLEERMAWGDAWTDSGYVFTKEDGDPIHPHTCTQTFNRRVKASGFPRIRFHDLRHTHASLLLAAGVPAKVVQERLGHSSISITLDVYSHVAPGMQADAAQRLGALVFGT